MYVRKDARILFFCSRRCEKNLLKLERNPRTTAYTVEGRKTKQQQMSARSHALKKDDAPKEEVKPVAKKSAKKTAKK